MIDLQPASEIFIAVNCNSSAVSSDVVQHVVPLRGQNGKETLVVNGAPAKSTIEYQQQTSINNNRVSTTIEK